ncbi:MAG: response regulator [Euryarchaeota archaeon]|nr:response regulator [Euryarchaeota archaeon]
MTKVLIADDEEAILESTASLLELFGFDVVVVSEPSDIIDTMRRERPDVLLQDVRMPDFDINRHLERLHADPELRSVPVIIFSAYVNAREIAQQVGADGAIEKPFDPEDLRDVIERVVTSRPTPAD